MTKNPILNALVAVAYISIIGTLMNFSSHVTKPINGAGSIVQIAFISLFTLSAAMMGYCFLFTPLKLYIDGDKKEGSALFVKTIIAFAVITAILFLCVLAFVLI